MCVCIRDVPAFWCSGNDPVQSSPVQVRRVIKQQNAIIFKWQEYICEFDVYLHFYVISDEAGLYLLPSVYGVIEEIAASLVWGHTCLSASHEGYTANVMKAKKPDRHQAEGSCKFPVFFRLAFQVVAVKGRMLPEERGGFV